MPTVNYFVYSHYYCKIETKLATIWCFKNDWAIGLSNANNTLFWSIVCVDLWDLCENSIYKLKNAPGVRSYNKTINEESTYIWFCWYIMQWSWPDTYPEDFINFSLTYSDHISLSLRSVKTISALKFKGHVILLSVF